MSLLLRIVYAAAASSTHRRVALDALGQLHGPDMRDWGRLFLKHHEVYLAGATAPDDQFRDYANHVLYPRDEYWGGVVPAAKGWYARLVGALRHRRWREAAFAAGVLSHYLSDVLQPLHTAQSDASLAIVRPLERSVECAYDELLGLCLDDAGEWPRVELARDDDWLMELLVESAELARTHYETLVEHYSLELAARDPRSALDTTCQDILAALLGRAIVTTARVLERAIREARAVPPAVYHVEETMLAIMQIPLDWVRTQLHDLQQRAVVEAIYQEVRLKGKAIVTLGLSEQQVRRQYAIEVLHVPLDELDVQAVAPTGQHYRRVDPRVVSPPKTSASRAAAPPPPPSKPVHSDPNDPELAPPRDAASRRSTMQWIKDRLRRDKAVSEPSVAAPPALPGETPRLRLINWVNRRLKRFRSSEEDPDAPSSPPPPATKATPSKAPPVESTDPELRVPSDEKTGRRWMKWIGSGLRRDKSPADESAAPSAPPPPPQAPPPAPMSMKKSTADAASKFELELTSPIESAPSVSRKIAEKLQAIGVETIDDLLNLEPADAVRQLKLQWLDEVRLRSWQDQSRLMCSVPELSAHAAQVLTGAGIYDAEMLRDAEADELLNSIEDFLGSSEGQRFARTGPTPDRAAVVEWIDRASRPRSLNRA